MKIAKSLAISLVIVLMLPTVAEALVEVRTHLTLEAGKTKVRPGRMVMFSGRLSARYPACYRFQTVRIYKNGSPDGVITTRSTGRFYFTRTINAKVTYSVAYFGKIVGMHPHQKICKASGASATVDICRWRPHRALATEIRSSWTGCS